MTAHNEYFHSLKNKTKQSFLIVAYKHKPNLILCVCTSSFIFISLDNRTDLNPIFLLLD